MPRSVSWPFADHEVPARRGSPPPSKAGDGREGTVNPFMLSVTIDGLSIRDRHGVGLSSRSTSSTRTSSSLPLPPCPGRPRGHAARPKVTIVPQRGPDLQRLGSPRVLVAPAVEPSKPLRFSFNNIRVEGGSIDFDDRSRERDTRFATWLSHPVRVQPPLRLDEHVEPFFDAKVTEPRRLEGQVQAVQGLARVGLRRRLRRPRPPPSTSSTSPSRSRRGSSPAALGEARRSRSFRRSGSVSYSSCPGGRSGEPHHRGRGSAPLVALPPRGLLASLDVFGRKGAIESARFDARRGPRPLARTRA